MATIGIHLIWTTYGTWLPGDPRGHWSPLFDCYGGIIDRGGKLNRQDLTTHQYSHEQMNESAKILAPDEIAVVADTIGAMVRRPDVDTSDPTLPWVFAAAVEATHMHLLLGPIQESIGIVAGRFKGATSSAVLRISRDEGRKRTWTAKYWKVFLFDALAFETVKKYIEAHNLRRGLSAAPFPWISPVADPP